MTNFEIELLDKINHIQERLRMITSIQINQLLLLEQRLSEDFEDIQKQLKQLKEVIRPTEANSDQQ